jgi:outer membrane protein OmpA-like peptidoglycan-associated protein
MYRRLGWTAAVCVTAMLGATATAGAQGFGSLSKLKKKADEAKKAADDSKKKKDDSKPADAAKSDESKDSSSTAAAGGSSQAKNGPGGQPDLTAAKIDFVPGERTVFYDDFSDMAPDEPPPHWKVRGGEVALKLGGGVRELMPGDGVVLTSGSIPFPKDFTLELVCDCQGEIDFKLLDKNGDAVMDGSTQGNEARNHIDLTLNAHERLGGGEIDVKPGELDRIAVWAQQGRVRGYLNGERIIDANQVKFGGIDRIEMHASRYRPTGIRSVRVAESAPDVSTVLASTGMYVSHGINFYTDSDRIKPESAGAVRMVANALIKNANLKLAITGYTDSTGNADHNLDLSRRRAEAVKTVLVSQFSIDASRLTADGKGANNPIASNDTPDGRAQNRRVEFVKQ